MKKNNNGDNLKLVKCNGHRLFHYASQGEKHNEQCFSYATELIDNLIYIIFYSLWKRKEMYWLFAEYEWEETWTIRFYSRTSVVNQMVPVG